MAQCIKLAGQPDNTEGDSSRFSSDLNSLSHYHTPTQIHINKMLVIKKENKEKNELPGLLAQVCYPSYS